MATLTWKLCDPQDGGIPSSQRGDPPSAPSSGSAGQEGKKKKKKEKKSRNMTKEKNKPTNEQKKRGHPSTPSHSDDSEKPQMQQSTQTEKSSDLNHAKGNTKDSSARKCRKGKTIQTAVVKESPASDKEDKTDVSSQTLESLRWEGVLDDPVAEAERLEVYKANRRKRYMAFKQTLLEDGKVAVGSQSDGNNLHGRTCKPGSAAIN